MARSNWDVKLPNWGDAAGWADAADDAGYRVTSTPEVGTIAVRTLTRHGHVAWVLDVSANNLKVSEMNCDDRYPAGHREPDGYSKTFFQKYISLYSISGRVLRGDNGLGGVQVSLSGLVTKTTTTARDGRYEFAGLKKGTYTITPRVSQHTFSPPSKKVTITASSIRDQDFRVSTPSSLVPSSGLVAHYKFEGNYLDSSRHGNHGSPVGTVGFTAGVVGQALKFYGVSNRGYIRVPNSASLQFTDQLTVSFFLRVDSSLGQTSKDTSGRVIDEAMQAVFAKRGDRKGFYVNVIVHPEIGQIDTEFSINPYNPPHAYVQHRLPCRIGQWVHLAFVVRSGQIVEYINGLEVARRGNQSISFTRGNSENLYIGIQRNPEAGLEFWYPLNGAIDELRFYNKTIPSSEIHAFSRSVSANPTF